MVETTGLNPEFIALTGLHNSYTIEFTFFFDRAVPCPIAVSPLGFY
jgi:hypothetical protein